MTHAYLVKASMRYIKYLTFLFFEDNDSISTKPATQILPLNLEYTFLLWNFLITGLCNFLASYSLMLTPDPAFLSKKIIDHTC